ncbi:hypothetical protein [Mesorhizobium sp. Cs1321R2N1]|uniref:hypothetical protein n=1 Tax=Mesorhizobium sp. Cs1321R2N1 TaxID=3015174 RepID=UPI00301D2194
MLSSKEFSVGTLSDAKPFSLMLPRGGYEATFLIGQIEGGPAAVFLGGNYNFVFFETSAASNWAGLLIPNIRVEVDEASVFDPRSVYGKVGAVVRSGTEIVIYAKRDGSYGGLSKVTLETGLLEINPQLSAGFTKWQLVNGEGLEKRVLLEVDADKVETGN